MNQKILYLTKNNFLLLAFVALGIIAFISRASSTPPPIAPPVVDSRSADTYVPAGFTLVPIEITNSESLSSLVGEVGGVVDLYLASTDKQKGGKKIATKIKLIRAPLNPEQYAVFVKDGDSERILQYPGPFVAVIHNPKTSGTEVYSSPRAQEVKIEYQN